MPTPLDDLSGSSLLAVFAHPDDESLASGGLLALCAERGVRVSLLCLTRGEHGRGHDSERLGHIRTAELRDAARVLGIRDLEVLDHEDGMLVWADHTGLEADILGAISRFEPGSPKSTRLFEAIISSSTSVSWTTRIRPRNHLSNSRPKRLRVQLAQSAQMAP